MKVLVTGGAGFIGSHLCDALLALGHDVLAVDNFLTGTPDNVRHLAEHPRFRLHEQDVTEPLAEDGWQAIFHLASPASPVGYSRYPVETLLVNAQGTYRILELALACNARLLLASTSEVYGDPLVHPQPESYWGNVNPIGPRACYDEGKRYAEAITSTYQQTHGLNARIIRIFNTYGPRNQPEDGRMVPTFITQALTGQAITVFGDGAQTRSICYVRDLVDGILRAMFQPGTNGEVFNLGNPEEHTVLEYAQAIKHLVGSEADIVCTAPRPEEISRRRPDIAKARRVLGWEPTTGMTSGLQETIAWVQAQLAGRSGGRR
ncbi:MAG: SDR family oxidoreductase [Chloroflexi bacterium]|nr:SDR family oxidoreductase [Chloroflexota bacterium]